MSGIFNTMNTASKGLMAQQTAIHTVGHNLSNANTPGFSRQRVDMQADLAYNLSGVGQLGTGVKMTGIIRMVNEYIHNQIMVEKGTMEKFAVKSETIGQLEIIFNEPSQTGLSHNLGEMFDSFQELSKNPESLNAKTVVVEQAKALANTLNHMSNQIDKLEDNTISQIKKNAFDFNTTIDGIKSLNRQIFNTSIKGQVPNDLLDQRDLMLKELSGITEFEHSFDEYGRVDIRIDKKQILKDNYEMSMVTDIKQLDSGEWKVSLAKSGDSLGGDIFYTTDNIDDISVGDVVFNNKNIVITDGQVSKDDFESLSLKSGILEGYKESLNDINERKDNLDNFAKYMAKAINTVHSGEVNENSENNFFESIDGGPINAGNIKVQDKILKDNSNVNAGENIGDPDSPEGDGSRALALARLRNSKISFVDQSDPFNPELELKINDDMTITDPRGSVTIEGSYIDIVTKVGVSKQHSDQMVENQEVLLAQLEFKRESTSGVSIDEEVSNLVQFQKAYEANAKMLSVLTDMLDVLINRTGV